MDSVDRTTDYIGQFWSQLASDMPRVLGAIIILLIGYIVAKVVATVVRKALATVNFNQHLQAAKGGNIVQRAIPNPAGLLTKTTFWLIFLFAISVAISSLGIPALDTIVNGVYSYIPNVIAALLIFLVAGAVSTAVAGLVSNAMGDTPTGKILAAAAPTVVMAIAGFMILNQLRIAPEIVTITYAGIVATATLAFGLGGKDAASKFFMDMYAAGQQKQTDVARDMKQGSRNAKRQANEV